MRRSRSSLSYYLRTSSGNLGHELLLQRYITFVVLENLCLIDERVVLAQDPLTNREDEAMR